MKFTTFLLPVAVCTFISQTQASPIAWQRDWRTASELSIRQHKPILLLVTASWCGPCHRMLEQSFPDPTVSARVNSQFIPLVIDADQQPGLVQQLNVEAMPTMIVMNSQRRILSRHTGFLSASGLNAQLAAYPSPRWPVVARKSRPPINPPLGLGYRRICMPVMPPAVHIAVGPALASTSSATLADAFRVRKPHDTLAAAKHFGLAEQTVNGSDWGILALHPADQAHDTKVSVISHKN